MTTTTAGIPVPRDAIAARSTFDGSRGGRVAAVAGLAFVVFNVAGTFLPGAPPASDASTAKIAAYFKDHSGAIKAQLLLGGLGIAALMWWFGTLWRIMSRAEDERPRLAIVAGVALAAGLTLAIVNGVANATAALRSESPDAQHLLYTLSFVVIAAAGFALGAFLIAVSSTTYRSRVLPRWISYLGFAAALAFVASGAGTVSDANVFNLLGLVAFLGWCIWILALCRVMWTGTAVRG
jgi:hypothetical protein